MLFLTYYGCTVLIASRRSSGNVSLPPAEHAASKRVGVPLGEPVVVPKHWGFESSLYQCRSCKENSVSFYYFWAQLDLNDDVEEEEADEEDEEEVWMFQKIGQYPPIQERIDPVLQKGLGDDLGLYVKAIRSRNFG